MAAAFAPEWGHLLPAGPELSARDGRRWTFDPRRLLSAFAAEKVPLAIDYEHGQDEQAPKGNMAPAAGWITALEERSGEIWAKIDWTAKAASLIAAKEYRFLSASMSISKSNEVLCLLGAALVNRPALHVKPFDHARTESDIIEEARRIARAAETHRGELAATGIRITTSQAVAAVQKV